MAGAEQHAPNYSRHPELVSGPISRFSGSKRGQTQPDCQIRPMRVVRIDEVDLPLPVPALQLLLAQDRRFHFSKLFEMNEYVNGILGRETGVHVIAMLPNPSDEVGCNPDVDRAVRLARKDISAGLALLPHEPVFAAKWVLKQVQDDDKGGVVQ
jgi:hypothetical protein